MRAALFCLCLVSFSGLGAMGVINPSKVELKLKDVKVTGIPGRYTVQGQIVARSLKARTLSKVQTVYTPSAGVGAPIIADAVCQVGGKNIQLLPGTPRTCSFSFAVASKVPGALIAKALMGLEASPSVVGTSSAVTVQAPTTSRPTRVNTPIMVGGSTGSMAGTSTTKNDPAVASNGLLVTLTKVVTDAAMPSVTGTVIMTATTSTPVPVYSSVALYFIKGKTWGPTNAPVTCSGVSGSPFTVKQGTPLTCTFTLTPPNTNPAMVYVRAFNADGTAIASSNSMDVSF